MVLGRVSAERHRADYKPEGKEWITVASAARWLEISWTFSITHLFSFKLRIIPALYQVHGNNLSNV